MGNVISMYFCCVFPKDDHFPHLLLHPMHHLESQSLATVVLSKGTQKFIRRRRRGTVSKTSSLFDPLRCSKENKTIEIETILQTKIKMGIQ